MQNPARQVKDFGKGRHPRPTGKRHRCYLDAVRFHLGQVGQVLLPGEREVGDLAPRGEVPDEVEHHRAAAVCAGVG